MKRFLLIGALVCASAFSASADPAIAAAQETLKQQGFYYGGVTGQKDADTAAAIRRFQIRNGLAVNGNLDAETQRALKTGTSNSAAPPRATATPAVTRRQQPQAVERIPEEEDNESSPEEQDEPRRPSNAPNVQDENDGNPGTVPYGAGAQEMNADPRSPLGGTPYATAPWDVQQQIVMSAQLQLARRGLYRSEVDGIFGPGTEFALRAFQSDSGLAQTGRLDVDTLSVLRLLPNEARRSYARPRRMMMFPQRRPVLRGEWIRE